MKLKFFIFFALCSWCMSSQETPGFQIPNYAAKTPEAAAFLKYGEYPVNLSTGLPGISIPLYTIQIPGYTLPITLDYHASGIKVDQEASWVGLGWNVNYGAQIILSVRDDIDENNSRIDDMPLDSDFDYYDAHPYDFQGGPIVSKELDKSRVKDVYSFSSPTASGEFYIRDGSVSPSDIVVYPPEAFKVETIGGINDQPSGGRERFRITDPQGNVYIFRTSEISYRKETHHDNYKSAWYVDEIRTPTNHSIYFYYDDDGVSAEHSLTQKVDISKIQLNCNCNQNSVQNPISSVLSQGGTTYTYVKRIREIVFDNGNSKVVFNRINDRQDLKSGVFDVTKNYSISRLNTLEIRHKPNSSVNTFDLVNGYSFHYGYYNDDATGTLAYMSKRLRLDRVMTLLEGDTHEFVYNTDNDLPTKGSFSKDYYGYFNGKNNANLIPVHNITTPYITTIGGADRSVVENKVKAGVLTEIHYPTKGWTKFNYESNRYFTSTEAPSSATVALSTGDYHPDIDFSDVYDPDDALFFSADFTVNNNTTGILNMYVNHNLINQPTHILQRQFVRLKIFEGSDMIYDSGQQNAANQSDGQEELVESLSLSSGSYSMIIECYGKNVRMSTDLHYQHSATVNTNAYAAGLRVANIENYDHDGTLLLKKNYEYNRPDDESKSSGKLVNGNIGFNFTSGMFKNFTSGICSFESPAQIPATDFNFTYSISSEGLYGVAGNAVVYEYVTEKQVDSLDTALGYTLYKFTTGPDIYVNPSVMITTPWKRGKVLEKKVYKTVNNTDYILQKEENTYVEDNAKIAYVEGFQMKRFANVPVSEQSDPTLQPWNLITECGMPSDVNSMVAFQKFNIAIPWYYLSKTTNTEYYYNTSNVLTGTMVTDVDYVYSNPSHLQLSKQVTTTSDGTILENRYYYPGDSYVQSEPYVNNLINANMVSTPLVTQTYLGAARTQQQKTIYNLWPTGNPNINMLQPEIIQASKGGNALEDRIIFVQRDEAGNPVEVKLADGVSVCYIWAYDNSKVVAKLENATYSNIAPSIIQNIKSASISGNEANLITLLNNLRTSQNDALVTTFTYIPLIGLHTVTDPKGYQYTYEMDNLGRLRFVKDQDGNIITENNYHYKN
ncbi:hypothetical protein [Flavobacterium beibuense]|uniref:hypothetical protein n=1 Tax=Flavobacterium beibuense TaxID=657326 RepID=UPI003A90F898